jgi:succinate dehydrogenase / fumarate reductase iron-sulfur subunit
MNFKLRIWRQKGGEKEGRLVDYNANDISPDTSFLEMLDEVNERLTERRRADRVRVGLAAKASAGTCSLTISGEAHGPDHPGRRMPALHAPLQGRLSTITVEPFRARSFPIVRDLVVVNRSALDRIVQAGGYVPRRSGSAPEANSIPVPKQIRSGDGSRGLHRLRLHAPPLAECLGDAVYFREGCAPRLASAGAIQSALTGC